MATLNNMKSLFSKLFLLFLLVFTNPLEATQIVTSLSVGAASGIFKHGESVSITYSIYNKSNAPLQARIGGNISFIVSKVVKKNLSQSLNIPAWHRREVVFTFSPQEAGIYNIYLQVSAGNKRLALNSHKFGYALERLDSPLSRREDFDAFWTNTKNALAAVPPQFKLTYNEKLSAQAYDVYLLEMRSLNNFPIKAWYRLPKIAQKVPVILQIPSLGGSFFDVKSLEERPLYGVPYDFAVLSLNIRGHGNSKGNIQVSDKFFDFITYGLESRETYVYRGAIADCMRAIDFLMTRPEVDQSKIVVEGASQGGGLSLLLAGLDPRVALCAPDVPFLCDIEQLIASAGWVKKEIEAFTKRKNISWWRAKYYLSYFDTKNVADKIKAPVLMSVGLQDWTCPAATALVTYNKIVAPKECMIYPKGKHGGGGALHRRRKFAWIRQQLNY